MKFPIPSETSMRSVEKSLYQNNLNIIKDYLSNGLASKPSISYLVCCDILESFPNNIYVKNKICGVISSFNLNPNNFILLITDAASYMVLGGEKLKYEKFILENNVEIAFKNLFHVTCVVHLYHNMSAKIASYYKNANNLVISMNLALSKSKARNKLFKNIPLHPTFCKTRFGDWLKVIEYFSKYYLYIKNIVDAFETDGAIVSKVKVAVNHLNLCRELVDIMHNYYFLYTLIKQSCSVKYTISDAIDDLNNLNFKRNHASIKLYVEKRLINSDIKGIEHLIREDITPSQYAKLLMCQATSISVERRFSILHTINAKERNFKAENLAEYVLLKYNLGNKI
ncbi:hypothetical protein A3Q56_07514 [Intoshia linei]|uniref:Uncharacterized protein n=1 Tax=Intoshia linei TaxID=1819745 RepID=A0A177AU62_9BILA|nr:hypothetical protein A3Q56_07514 [Intoshia linei]